MGEAAKTCSTCFRSRSLSAYHADRSARDGLAASCRECRNIRSRARYQPRPKPQRRGRPAPQRQTIERIVEVEAQRIGADPRVIMSDRRQRGLQVARGKVWQAILTETGCTVTALAKAWGGDRSTIHHALKALAAAQPETQMEAA